MKLIAQIIEFTQYVYLCVRCCLFRHMYTYVVSCNVGNERRHQIISSSYIPVLVTNILDWLYVSCMHSTAIRSELRHTRLQLRVYYADCVCAGTILTKHKRSWSVCVFTRLMGMFSTTKIHFTRRVCYGMIMYMLSF